MYFLAMFDNSVVKPFIIADNNALSHLGRGILSYLCPLAGGILSEGILSRGGFCPFPVDWQSLVTDLRPICQFLSDEIYW